MIDLFAQCLALLHREVTITETWKPLPLILPSVLSQAGSIQSDVSTRSVSRGVGSPLTPPNVELSPTAGGIGGFPVFGGGYPSTLSHLEGGFEHDDGAAEVTCMWPWNGHIYIHPPSIPLIASLTKKTRKAKLGTFFLLWSHIYNFEMVLFPFLYILLGKASCRDTFVRTHTYALISPDSHISSFTQHLFI